MSARMERFSMCQRANAGPLFAEVQFSGRITRKHASCATLHGPCRKALAVLGLELRNRVNIETAEKLVFVKANMPVQWYR